MFGSRRRQQVVYVRDPRNGGCVTCLAMVICLGLMLFVLLMCGGILWL